MILATDVQYDEAANTAQTAGVLFENWSDARAAKEYVSTTAEIAPYIPGQFYLREMPCLLALLEQITEPVDLLIVDGYVRLGDKPGLGMHLWNAVERRFPVVGVAKSHFHESRAEEVFRGQSKHPLYVTAVDCEAAEAARRVRHMHGEFRIPTLLKRVDELARKKAG